MKTKLNAGDKHNKWTVIKFDCVDEKRRVRYICQCECGDKHSVMAASMVAGRSKSCIRCRQSDLSGRVIGLWTVIGRSDIVSDATKSKTQWLCKCKCGKEKLVERCNLVRGGSKGCWECRRNVVNAEKFPRIWYRRLLTQAKQRDHSFELNELELWQIWESQNGICPLTGLEIKLTNKQETTTASADRIKNNLGYIKGNVWFIHKHVNIMKYTYDLEYFVEMCDRISKNKMGVA